MPTPRAYYNEIDPYCAQWLRNLIQRNIIAPGDVDTRDIRDIVPTDLAPYTQCHFFAGIGGWSHALRLAAVPDHFPLWTGSCPCQPFSQAGKRRGFADERHLWPHWYHLIQVCRPSTIFGEQVASPDGLGWLDGVSIDLESSEYAFGAADLCAAGVSAPHPRQRLYWVGVADKNGWQTRDQAAQTMGFGNSAKPAGRANYNGVGNSNKYDSFWWDGPLQVGWNAIESIIERGGRQIRAQWRVKPGLPIVAYGVPNRVERCGAAGNAIVPQCAAQFIKAALNV